ncbi:TonB-dependent siderophore receptor [Steroidobacter sp.]|uniref:TonB-dependent siderophore receptor n=1 Tax=Steroidobacter sp. TaxID=1978227 RepID=UPI001A3ECBBD|nr:TonB-dependent siderophore receptor [Steroidobacter sp.]MBL8265979.1 TonB-dependent siderophore receptor [Steroidobacter sp.]
MFDRSMIPGPASWLAASVCTVTLSAPLHAQVVSFDVPEQDAVTGISEFARQADVQILAANEVIAGKRTAAVHGSYSVDAGLGLLLKGTDIVVGTSDSRTYTLKQQVASADAPRTLDEVVVTATKTDTPLIEAPQSISVVSSDEMALRGVQDLNQALSYTTGIKFRDYPGGQGIQDFYLRGFRANTNGESVYRDGLRQQYTSLTGNVEPYALERIELLKGPASVLYGQGNPGGLVNLTTKRPTDEPVREVQLKAGSYDHYQIGADFGDALSSDGKLLYRLTGMYRDSELQYDYGRDDRFYVAPALTWRISDATSVTLLGQYFETTTSGSEQSYPAIGTLFANPNGQISHERFLGNPDWNRINMEYASLGYLFNTRLTDSLRLNQVVRYSDSQSEFHNTSDRSLGLLVNNRLENRGANDRDDTEKQLSADTNLEYDLETGSVQHRILGGFDYARVRTTLRQLNGSAGFLDLYAPVYDIPIVWNATLSRHFADGLNQYGVYLQDQLKWNRFVVTLNARHDTLKTFSRNRLTGVRTELEDKKLTGRAGAVYEFDSGFAPYVSYSTSFQPSAAVTWDGKLFEPTEGKQVEGGLKYQPRGTRSSVTATVYQLTQINVSTPDVEHAGFNTQQGEVRSRGFELEARTPVGESFNLIFAYAYTDAKVTKANPNSAGVTSQGLRQLGVPRHSASGWLDYTFSSGVPGLNLGGGVRYVGEAFNTPNTIEFPSYVLVDVGAHYSFGSYKLGLNVTNLTNKDYFNPGFYPNSVYYGYKRMVLGTLTRNW